jgi:hypothetical protein
LGSTLLDHMSHEQPRELPSNMLVPLPSQRESSQLRRLPSGVDAHQHNIPSQTGGE